MARKGRARLRLLTDELARAHPSLGDPAAAIARGEVAVDGIVVRNPASQVRAGSSITLTRRRTLRGEAKLAAALAAFGIDPRGGVALDVGAAAGGFTLALLASGAVRVYAVDAGHGELLGSLRQNARVVVLERTNLAQLDRSKIPEPVHIVTLDLSYLALAAAVPQLAGVTFAPGCEMLALVKPQYELGLAAPPHDAAGLRAAVERASAGIADAGWAVCDSIRSPHAGGRGAIEFFIHARRADS